MAEQESYFEVLEVPRQYLIARTGPMPFGKGKKLVETAEGGKFRIPSIYLNQQLRQERGYLGRVSKDGNWVLEGVLYRQKANNVLTRIGFPYLHLREAVLANSRGNQYTLDGCTQDEIDKAVAEGLEIDPKDLNTDGCLVIPCKEFGSNKYGLWFFGGEGEDAQRSKRAEESGKWLIGSPQKIAAITIYLNPLGYSIYVGRDYANPESVGSDYANQFWFGDLSCRSVLDGCGRWYGFFPYDGRILGVFDSAEGTAPKK